MRVLQRTCNIWSRCILSNTVGSRSIGQISPAILANTVDSKKVPTVVILGWAYSKDSHVQRYVDMHNSFGHHTLTYTCDPNLFFSFDYKNQLDLSRKLLAQLKSEHNLSSSIFLHAFSINGFCLYQHLGELIERDPDLEMCGAVLDSCPIPAHFGATVFARKFGRLGTQGDSVYFTFASFIVINLIETKNGLIETLKRARALYPKLRYNWATFSMPPNNPVFRSPGLHLYHEKLMFPIQLLYSPKDYIIPSSFLKVCGEHLRKRGRFVEEVDFKTSGHVDHYRKHPDLYKEKVKGFIDGAMTSFASLAK